MGNKKIKIPTNREATILSILINSEKYGRQIRNEFQEQTGKMMPLGSLYVTLERMVKYGLLEVVEKSKSSNESKKRKFFRATGDGKTAFENYIASAAQLKSFIGAV